LARKQQRQLIATEFSCQPPSNPDVLQRSYSDPEAPDIARKYYPDIAQGNIMQTQLKEICRRKSSTIANPDSSKVNCQNTPLRISTNPDPAQMYCKKAVYTAGKYYSDIIQRNHADTSERYVGAADLQQPAKRQR